MRKQCVESIDLYQNGRARPCVILKHDSRGYKYLIDLSLMDMVDERRMSKLLESYNTHVDVPLWQFMSEQILSNGINALVYFHQMVKVLSPMGKIVTAQRLFEETMTKPLFPKQATPAAQDAGPKPLTFPNMPLMPTKIAVFDHCTRTKSEEVVPPPVKTFAGVQPTPPQKAPSSSVPSGLFATSSDANVVAAAVAFVQKEYGHLGFANARIESQIRQLSPLNMDVLSNWGMKPLAENAELVLEVAKIVKLYTALNSPELIDAAQKAARAVPFDRGFLGRMFSERQVSIAEFKPKLEMLVAELNKLQPQVERLVSVTAEMEKRLLLNVAALAATCEVNGNPTDQALAQLMHNRRTLLTQASTQVKLVNVQIDQIRKLIVDQQSMLVQMIHVTIPAFELANASR